MGLVLRYFSCSIHLLGGSLIRFVPAHVTYWAICIFRYIDLPVTDIFVENWYVGFSFCFVALLPGGEHVPVGMLGSLQVWPGPQYIGDVVPQLQLSWP